MPYYIIDFALFYLVKLIRANIFIAYDIITPGMRIRPDFISIPLDLESNFGLLLFSNLLSMTPGTLSINISDDRKQIVVHVLYSDRKEIIMKEIAKIQGKIKKITD